MIKIKTSKKTAIFGLVILLILGGSAIALNKPNDKSGAGVTAGQGETINYGPPTEEDAKRVEENKKRVEARQEQEKQAANQSSPSPSGKKSVKPLITYAGQYDNVVEVGAGVDGIFENGGQCVAKFTRDSRLISKTVNAIQNMSSVDCPVMSVPASEFSQKGIWNVVVTYSSKSASGTSDSRQVEIK